MKKAHLIIVFLFCALMSYAQEQPGIVKTIGRPGMAGKPLEGVLVRVHGCANATMSDSTGNFHLTMANYQIGQAYSLSHVFRIGYQLADDGTVGRQYPFSDNIPLEIAMVSNEMYDRTKSQIESEVRTIIEKEYQVQVSRLQQQLADKTLSEEKHIQQLCELNDYYDNATNLINKLADRYAKMDYDRLDSVDVQICSCIEQGRLEEAEVLIEGKGTRQTLKQLKIDNQLLEKSLEDGKKAETELREKYAAELKTRHEIASLRLDNEAAAAFLKERMELDTTRVVWGIEYAMFIQEYLDHYDEAMEILQNALRIQKDSSLLDDLYGSIGNLHHRLGNYDEALEAYHNSANIRMGNGLYVNGLAKSYYNIASVHLKKNEYDSTYMYLEKARVIYNELADSLGIASVYMTMADNAEDHGKYNEALDYAHRALRIRIAEYGDGHQRVGIIYNSIAEMLRTVGRFDEALDYAGKAYEVFVRIFGERHPYVASAYMSMGVLAMELEDFDKALEYYQNALGIYESCYNKIHPDLINVYFRLSNYYGEAKSDYSAAILYLNKCKDLVSKIHSTKHSIISILLNNLAVYYSRMEQFDKAIEAYNESLGIRQELYGKDNLFSAEIYHNMASLYSQMDKYDEAIDLQQKALKIFVQSYGETHPNIVTAYNNIGLFYIKKKDFVNGLEYLNLSKSVSLKIYGEDHTSIATTCVNMATAYKKLGQYEKAEELALEALEISRRRLGEDHSSTLSSYNTLALLYQDMGNFDKAENYMKRSLEISLRLYGENSVDVIVSYSNIATLYNSMDKPESALEVAHKALDIACGLFDEGHSRVILCRYGVADCYAKMERYDDAISYLSPLYYEMFAAKGPTHDYTKRFFFDLHASFAGAMGQDGYDGRYDEDFQKLNTNSVVTVKVEENSPASKMGLTGTYYMMSYEEWTLDQNDVNFFAFVPTVSSRPEKTYVFYRDDEFIKVPVEGYMGIWFNPQWVTAEEKLAMIKKYKKWARKNR